MNPGSALVPNPGVTQSQSQSTVKGDPAYPSLSGFEEDQDSDREEQIPFSTHDRGDMKKPIVKDDGQPEASGKNKGKQRARVAARRFTIEPGDLENEVLLTDITQDDANAVHAVIGSSEDFVSSALRSPEEWRDGLKNMIESVQICRENLATLQQQNQEATREVAEAQAKSRALTGQLRDANARATKEEEDAARIRRLRDRYRSMAEDLYRENEQLKAATIGKSREEEELIDSDAEEHRDKVRSRHGSAPLSNLRSNNRPYTPVTGIATERTGIAVSNNKRYPDVPDFYGSKDDRHKWDGWRMHLYSKFRQSAGEFPNELDKIDYVRDHCKDTAFDVIKTRSDMSHYNPYSTADEMIVELDAMFGTYDKVAKSDAELHDPNFGMGVKEKKETFEAFYARFSAAIAPLDYSDTLKISNLKRLINTRLRYRISGESFSTFRELVARLRHIAADFEAIDKANPNKDKDNKTGGGQGGAGGSSGSSRNNNNSSSNRSGSNSRPGNSRQGSSYQGSGYKYPRPLIDRIVKENRCWKCLKTGHRSGDRGAPCKDAEQLTKEQVEVMMKTMGVETAEEQNPSELPERSEN